MQTRMMNEYRNYVFVAQSGQSFCHYVCQQARRFTVIKVNFAMLDFVTKAIILDVAVFCTALVDNFFRHLDAGLFVFQDVEFWSFLACRIQILQIKWWIHLLSWIAKLREMDVALLVDSDTLDCFFFSTYRSTHPDQSVWRSWFAIKIVARSVCIGRESRFYRQTEHECH